MANPTNAPQPLNYQGTAAGETLNEANAFSARRKGGASGFTLTSSSGDMLFRIFPTRERTFFIKLDSGTDQTIGLAFGLLGLAIQKMLTKNKRKQQVAEKLASFQGQRPAMLLAQDKASHVVQRAEMQKPELQPPSMFTDAKYGRFVFRDARGKKRIFNFEDTENFRAALKCLSEAFGDELTVKAQWNAAKNKVVKLKA